MRTTIAAFALLGMATAIHIENIDTEIDLARGTELAQTQALVQGEELVKSIGGGASIHLKFVNETDKVIQLYWHDWSGNLLPYGRLNPGAS